MQQFARLVRYGHEIRIDRLAEAENPVQPGAEPALQPPDVRRAAVVEPGEGLHGAVLDLGDQLVFADIFPQRIQTGLHRDSRQVADQQQRALDGLKPRGALAEYRPREPLQYLGVRIVSGRREFDDMAFDHPDAQEASGNVLRRRDSTRQEIAVGMIALRDAAQDLLDLGIADTGGEVLLIGGRQGGWLENRRPVDDHAAQGEGLQRRRARRGFLDTGRRRRDLSRRRLFALLDPTGDDREVGGLLRVDAGYIQKAGCYYR